MPKKLRLGSVLLFLLAVAAITVGPASSSGSRGDDDRVTVVRVTAVTVQDAQLDLGETGDSLGDEFLFSDDLFSGGKKVGMAGVVCTLVRLEPMVSATLQCVATAELPKGQLAGQGIDVARGRFGARMSVELAKDGPVTIVLDANVTNPAGADPPLLS